MPKCNILDCQITIVLPNYYKPCCQYTVINDLYKDVKVDEMSFTEYKKSPQFQQIKKDMETGWHKGCEKCRLDEQIGILSLRQYSNKNFTDEKIESIEISLSNYCNLSCKMCNNHSSSKWENYLNNNNELLDFFYKTNSKKIDLNDFFKNIDLKHLKHLKYLGGEPFITPETKKLFAYLEENNIIQNVEISINTNCTFYPEKWINQLLKFKKITLGLSIDGFDKSCEYSRTGSTWKILKQNVLNWKNLANQNKNLYLYIATTINAFTIHDYHKLKEFAESLNIGCNPYIIHSPSYLRLDALPNKYIENIKNKTNEKFLEQLKHDPELFESLKKFVKITDPIQNINITDYIPELAKYIYS